MKSRCRTAGREEETVNVPADNFRKADLACKAFGCTPYFSIVVDAGDLVRGFILPMSRLLALCPPTPRGAYWKMSKQYLDRYANDPEVKTFELRTQAVRWW